MYFVLLLLFAPSCLGSWFPFCCGSTSAVVAPGDCVCPRAAVREEKHWLRSNKVMAKDIEVRAPVVTDDEIRSEDDYEDDDYYTDEEEDMLAAWADQMKHIVEELKQNDPDYVSRNHVADNWAIMEQILREAN